jgi:hypothetical protein
LADDYFERLKSGGAARVRSLHLWNTTPQILARARFISSGWTTGQRPS